MTLLFRLSNMLVLPFWALDDSAASLALDRAHHAFPIRERYARASLRCVSPSAPG